MESGGESVDYTRTRSGYWDGEHFQFYCWIGPVTIIEEPRLEKRPCSRRGRVRYVEWLLEQRAYTMAELACECGVSVYTIARDVLLLQTDPPRRVIENDGGRYRIVG